MKWSFQMKETKVGIRKEDGPFGWLNRHLLRLEVQEQKDEW